MAQLTLRLLGSFEASTPGKPPLKFQTHKIKALLAYLAAEADQAHSREALFGLLWPDYPQSSAMKSLRHALASLRKTIGDPIAQPPYLIISRDTIQINQKSNIYVDVWDFEQKIRQQSAGDITETAIGNITAAINLYHGPFLDDLLCNSEIFDKWIQIRREGQKRQVCTAMKHLALIYLKSEVYKTAIDWARRLLELDSCDESAHRLLMEALVYSGQRSTALAQYETCRLTLQQELDIEPEPETQKLYEAIKNNLISKKDYQASVYVDESSQTVDQIVASTKQTTIHEPQVNSELLRNNLPAGWSPLIGRERELDEIAVKLGDPACRLLTLVGPGGIGKTHLALEAVSRQVDRFKDGVFFVSLAPIQDFNAISQAIAQELHFAFYPGGEPAQELLDYLRGRELLLLLDDFEHLLEGAGLVTEILNSAPMVKIVITSRIRLNLRNEYLFTVEGLDFPEPIFSNLGDYSAVKLFFEGAKRIQSKFSAAENELKAIGQICYWVQGMPLAVLLAAGWMEVLSPVEIVNEINARKLEFLEASWVDAPERQRSMRTVIDQSFNHLTQSEKEIFAGLSVFRGGFSLLSAQAVTGITLHELRALVDKSLVQRSSPGRYTLHELLRQYAEEALEQLPTQYEISHDRHAAYFATALAEWYQDLQGPRQFTALKEIGLELENILNAWNWMTEKIQVERMSQALFGFLNGILFFYGELSGTETLKNLFEKAASKLAPLVLPAPAAFGDGARLLASIWINQPKLSFQFSDKRSSLLQRSESLLKQLDQAGQDTRLEKGMLLRQMGIISAHVGRITEMQNQLGGSLNLFRELRDLRRTAFVLREWGFLSVLLGFQNDGYKMLQECILIEQRLGDKMSLSVSLSSMRETIWLIQGDYTEHEHLARNYFLSCEETGNTKLVATAKGELGAILLRQGKFSEGNTALRESVAMLDQIGAMAEMYLYSLFLSESQINLGQYEEAYRQCQTTLSFYRKNSQYVLMGYNLILLGWAALGLGNFAEAKQYLEEAVVVEPALRINDRGLGLASLVYVEQSLLQKDQAISHLIKALQIMIDYRMVPVFMIALPAIAMYLAENGEIERGVELYALASQFSYVANSCLFDNIAGQKISRLAEQLPDDVVDAAKSRGGVRDRMSTAKELFVEFQES